MNVTFQPFTPQGTVAAPPSKSDVHRAILCAALSKGVCTITPVALSEDIKATISCVESLGAVTRMENGTLTVDGSGMFQKKTAALHCGESGSTLRFLIPVAAAGGVNAVFTGAGRLPERPIGIYTDALPKAGVQCDTAGGLPLTISGQLRGGEFKIPGDVSSQFISGLLFALPLLPRDSRIVLTTPVQSRGNQRYVPSDYRTDGDWSQAAFFMTAGAIGGDVTVTGANIDSAQGDRRIAALLREFGAEVIQDGGTVRVRRGELKAIEIDASQIPDLVPILAVCASFAKGTTRIVNAARLRIKESDRLQTTAVLLNSLGGKVKELPDGLEITGVKELAGGHADGCNDHRIVMSAAVCAARSAGTITCTDAMSINKSYPGFYGDYRLAGGIAVLENEP